ncbi:hypothetical protein Clacol_001952 [Clathrus columnatus]|uniref:AMP-dependent synthetase/ligase domain-containing protein n=1 Tax=Clathrus columnatus TaxID=1419009 RepID=A0AAV5A2A9_9AGAM|nr:hypothetical protein Clacol_001952 [Clathrus columnatus]
MFYSLWYRTSGISYFDVVHIFAIIRAGCVPHLINVELSKTLSPLILDLLHESNACALFIDPSLTQNDFLKTKYQYRDIFTIKDVSEYPIELNRDLLPPIPINFPSEQLILVLHTSGSTGGRCKLVRQDFRTFSAQVKKRKHVLDKNRRSAQLTAPRIGSFCHTAQITEFLTVITHAGTVILTNPNFNSSKLIEMYQECHLTMIAQFSAFVTLHLKNSRTDPLLLNVLKSMDEILFCGSTIPESELQWAKENRIPILNAFGMTECGGLLVGLRDDPACLIPVRLEGLHYAFRSISNTKRDLEISLNRNQKIQRLEELIVLSNSIDCPHPTLRSKTDGHFHTGDLFEEVYKGRYLFRGRIDDLIKMENGRICDTKSIEDRLRKNCDDIIHACVVVGTNRPSPALLIEPKLSTYNKERLITSVELQLTEYNANVYEHERLTRNHITVVRKGSLPRTLKGNIRRNLAEQMFSRQLDQIYGS